jgi:hypothetical protein
MNAATHDAYSAIMAAFSDLCDLVVQSKQFDHQKDHIQSTLGKDGYILADHILSISHLLPPRKNDETLSVANNYTRDKAA